MKIAGITNFFKGATRKQETPLTREETELAMKTLAARGVVINSVPQKDQLITGLKLEMKG